MRTLPIIVIFLFQSAAFSATCDGSGLYGQNWLELPLINKRFLYKQGPSECGPAALFNSFSISRPEVRRSVDKLPGASVPAKFKNLMQNFALKDSEITPQIKRWRMGTDPFNEYFIAKDFLRYGGGTNAVHLFEESLVRNPDEPYGKLLSRFENLVRKSLEHGVAPILDIQKYLGNYSFDYKAGTSKEERVAGPTIANSFWWTVYSFAGGHFVTIYGIKRVSPTQLLLKVFDPDAYRTHIFEVFEETRFDMESAYDNSDHVRIDHGRDTFVRLPNEGRDGKIETPDGRVVNSPILTFKSETYWEPIGEKPPESWPEPDFPSLVSPREKAPPVYFGLFHFIGVR